MHISGRTPSPAPTTCCQIATSQHLPIQKNVFLLLLHAAARLADKFIKILVNDRFIISNIKSANGNIAVTYAQNIAKNQISRQTRGIQIMPSTHAPLFSV